MRVVMWGTYDIGKPRSRILLRGLRDAGVDLHEIHSEVWAGIDDKGHISGFGCKLRLLLNWCASYPHLIWRYLRAPAHDVVIIGYLGHLDVLVIWPFAKARGVPVVWDAFISLYNTVIEDRRMLTPVNPLAWLLYAWEWLACRAARMVILDTKAHAAYFAKTYRLKPERMASIMVGAETATITPIERSSPAGVPLRVLFYGQFIPLHGIETIVAAAQAAAQTTARTEDDEPIRWILIGRGQEQDRIRALIDAVPAAIEWIEWVDFAVLREHIAGADICLGIFGDTDKAARVIPNKVFQILAAGAPLITRDSPAIRELLSPDMPGVTLIPPADPNALLEAVRGFAAEPAPRRPLHRDIARKITPEALGKELSAVLREVVGR
ncbi:MAG: glycosyltransferase [Alphaproteobacteria bacterium]|nr:glycosyltransferase [Alphaproteobacteria bacterium]